MKNRAQTGFIKTSSKDTLFFLFGILPLLVIYLFHSVSERPISYFTRDTAAVLHEQPFAGFLSNVGIIFWVATASILLNEYWFLRDKSEEINNAHFFLYGGVISSLLLFDDFFMLHDRLLPRFYINEFFVYIFYGVLVFAYLLKFRSQILKFNYSLLILAFLFFSISLIVDRFPDDIFGKWYHLLEDGSKYIGIWCWFNFFFSSVQQGRNFREENIKQIKN
jgi:hypothetical protein